MSDDPEYDAAIAELSGAGPREREAGYISIIAKLQGLLRQVRDHHKAWHPPDLGPCGHECCSPSAELILDIDKELKDAP